MPGPVVLIGLLLLLGLLVTGVVLRARRRHLASDPGAEVLRLIRERYKCSDRDARLVYRCYLEYNFTAEGPSFQLLRDGRLSLPKDTAAMFDSWALEFGLTPSLEGRLSEKGLHGAPPN